MEGRQLKIQEKKTCWPETLWVPSNVVPGASHEVSSNLFHLYETCIKIGRSTIQLLAISPERPWVRDPAELEGARSIGEQTGGEECGSPFRKAYFQGLCYVIFWEGTCQATLNFGRWSQDHK